MFFFAGNNGQRHLASGCNQQRFAPSKLCDAVRFHTAQIQKTLGFARFIGFEVQKDFGFAGIQNNAAGITIVIRQGLPKSTLSC